MAAPKRGSRLITVDGQRYRWRVRHKPSYGQFIQESPLSFSVERCDTQGAILVVGVSGVHRPDSMVTNAEADAVVAPALVARAIHAALAAGWQPTEPGPRFHFAVEKEILRNGMPEVSESSEIAVP